MDSTQEAGFRQFVAARSTVLLHTAILLAGDPHRGRRLLHDALVQAYLGWRRIEREEGPDAFVRRHVARAIVTGPWPLRPHRRRRRQILPEADTAQPTAPDVSQMRSRLAQTLAGLPDLQRVTLVLRHYEEMTVSEVADALDVRPVTVVEASEDAMLAIGRRMRGHAPLSSSIRDELSRHLRSSPPPDFDTRELVTRGRRRARRRQMSTVLGVAALVVAACAAGSLIRLPELGGVLPEPTATGASVPIPPDGRIDYVTFSDVLVTDGRQMPVALASGQDAISGIDRVNGGWLITGRSADSRDYMFVDDDGVGHDFDPPIAGALVAAGPGGTHLAVLHEQTLSVLELPSRNVVERLDASDVYPSGLWLTDEHVVAYSQVVGVNPSAEAVSGTVVWERATGTRTVIADVRVVDVSAIARLALLYTETAEQTCLYVAPLRTRLRPDLRVRCFGDRSVNPASLSHDGRWVVMPDPARGAGSGVKMRVYAVEGLDPTIYSPPRKVFYGEGFWTVLGWEGDSHVVVTGEPGRRGMRVQRCSLVTGQCGLYDLPTDVVAVAVRAQPGAWP